ncbi:MAG: PIN domain nuclease [Nitrospiraceae bacterium]|nr:PIN domain nuclease [Nitrospiraceae bacterium]
MVIIDTSVWIFALRRNFLPLVKERVGQALIESDVAINGIIELELLGGVRNDKEYGRLKDRLDGLHYIEMEKRLWDAASRMAYDLNGKGANIPATDILIAASAIDNDAVLLHADAHFDTIARHSKLKVESLVRHVK